MTHGERKNIPDSKDAGGIFRFRDAYLLQRRLLEETGHLVGESRKKGLLYRDFTTKLPAVSANSTVTFPLAVAHESLLLMEGFVGYLSPPASASGSVAISVYNGNSGSPVLMASGSCESIPATGSLPLKVKVKPDSLVEKGQYIFATLSSDNADAVDGTDGLLTLSFLVCK